MLATTFEGRAEPCLSQNPDDSSERDLPLTISRAISRAMTWRDGEFAQLSLAERGMLVEVLRCVSRKQPEKGAFIRRDTLAIRLACSVATVTRVLARLEELGWILRDQVKSRVRGFQVGSIALTKAASTWLGLHLPSPIAQRQAPVSDACRTPLQSLQRQLPQAASPVDESTSKPHDTDAARLPEALRWLVEKVTPFGIFKLMGLARQRGLLLEAVTQQCQAQIRSAHNGFAYIQGLLALDKDWAYIAQTQAEKAAAVGEGAQVRDQLAEFAKSLEGRDFVRADGAVCKVRAGWVTVFAAADAISRIAAPMGSRPIDAAFVQGIESGELRSWSVKTDQACGSSGTGVAETVPARPAALPRSKAVKERASGASAAASLVSDLMASIGLMKRA